MTRQGINSERNLVHALWKNGYAAVRVPASGAGSSRYPLPDIICGNGTRYLAFELKTTHKDIIYINKSDIQKLLDFSQYFGAEPYIAVKFNKEEYFFLKETDLLKTNADNYKISLEYAKEYGLTFEMLINNIVKIKLNW